MVFVWFLMWGRPGVEIVHPYRVFPIYRPMTKYRGPPPVPTALREKNDFPFPADQVLGQITANTSLIILNSPNNPCGGAVPAQEVKRLVAGLERHPRVTVMSDEIYSQMLYGGRRPRSLLRPPLIPRPPILPPPR